MKIKIGLNQKSINNAIKTLNKAKNQLENQMTVDLLNGCYEWLKKRANELLSYSDIGENVKNGIMDGWTIETISANKVIVKNTHEKAVYVEFGVGLVGEESPHANASETNYEYNVESDSKDENGMWGFYVNSSDLDLPQSSLEFGTVRLIDKDRKKQRNRLFVKTSGAKGIMYAYNALMDLKEYGAKEVWNEIKAKYWG